MQVELSPTVVGGVDACFADSVKFSHKSCKRAAAQLTHFSCFCFYLRPQLAAPLLLYSFTICLLEIKWRHLCQMLSIQVNHSRMSIWYSSLEVCSMLISYYNIMQGFEEEKVEGSRDHMVLVSPLKPFFAQLGFLLICCRIILQSPILVSCQIFNIKGKGFFMMSSCSQNLIPFFAGFLHLRTGPHVTILREAYVYQNGLVFRKVRLPLASSEQYKGKIVWILPTRELFSPWKQQSIRLFKSVQQSRVPPSEMSYMGFAGFPHILNSFLDAPPPPSPPPLRASWSFPLSFNKYLS